MLRAAGHNVATADDVVRLPFTARRRVAEVPCLSEVSFRPRRQTVSSQPPRCSVGPRQTRLVPVRVPSVEMGR